MRNGQEQATRMSSKPGALAAFAAEVFAEEHAPAGPRQLLNTVSLGNDYEAILNSFPDLSVNKPIIQHEFRLKLKGSSNAISIFKLAQHFKLTNPSQEVIEEEEIEDEAESFEDNLDGAADEEIDPFIERLKAFDEAERAAIVKSVSRVKLPTDKKEIQIRWEGEDVRALTIAAIDGNTGLSATRKKNIKARFQLMRSSAHRPRTQQQKDDHNAIVSGAVEDLCDLAKGNGDAEFRGIKTPDQSFSALVIFSSNWPTRESFAKGNGFTEAQVTQMEGNRNQTSFDTVPLYCQTDSLTTAVCRERGLEPCDNNEAIDIYPCYDYARTTGCIPMEVCGPDWEGIYLNALEDILVLNLEQGVTHQLLSSGSACFLLEKLVKRCENSEKLHMEILTIPLAIAKPSTYKSAVTCYLYTLPSDKDDLKNFSTITKDYAPTYQRNAGMSTAQRIESCCALSFFRAWIPDDSFPRQFTATMARKSLDFQTYFPGSSRSAFYRKMSKLGRKEREEGTDLSETDPFVMEAIATIKSCCLPDDLELEHDTPLQRILEVWKRRSATTIDARIALENVREDLEDYLNLNEEASPADLTADDANLASAVLPYMTSYNFKALKLISPTMTDLAVLCELAYRKDNMIIMQRDRDTHTALWRKGPKHQTTESKAAADRYLRYHINKLVTLPTTLKGKLAECVRLSAQIRSRKEDIATWKKSETGQKSQAATHKKRRARPEVKAAERVVNNAPKAKARRKAVGSERFLCLDCYVFMSRQWYSAHTTGDRCEQVYKRRGAWIVGSGFTPGVMEDDKHIWSNDAGYKEKHVATAQIEAFLAGTGPDLRYVMNAANLRKSKLGLIHQKPAKPLINPPPAGDPQPLIVRRANYKQRVMAMKANLDHAFGGEHEVNEFPEVEDDIDEE